MIKEKLNLWQLLEKASQRKEDSSQAINIILNNKRHFEDIQSLIQNFHNSDTNNTNSKNNKNAIN